MNELNKLRNLLLKNEQEELQNLREKLENLRANSSEPEIIIERISPILSSIIKRSAIKDEKLLLDALSPLVFELIEQNFIQSKDKMTKQLAPLITQAIREQIKSQKDEVVDALYPVLGNMISKYVSKTFEEMMNTINNQITNGLSFSTFSRKIKAKVKGVSEAELLLTENAIANIRSVFLIHKDTGIVLSHAEHEENPIKEPEMIASMMTAIRSFVNDWVDKNESHHEIGTIEYGGSKIIIEPSGYSYLAVIVDGLVSTKTNEKIRNVMEKIVSDYWKEIKKFNGDMSNIQSEEIHKILLTLIDKNVNTKKSQKMHPLIYFIPILFLSWLAWIFYNNFVNSDILQKANTLLIKNPKLTMYRINPKVEDRILILDGVVPNNDLKILAEKITKNIKNLEQVKNEIVVIEQNEKIVVKKEKVIIQEKKISFLKDKIEFIINALNLNKNIKLAYTLNNKNELTLMGSVISKKDKEYIKSQFKNFEELSLIKDNLTIIPPFLNTIIYFDFNSTRIKIIEESKLIKLINTLSNLDSDLILKIIVSSDNIGTNKINYKLNMKRAENIKNYLKQKGQVLQNIEVVEKHKLLDNSFNIKEVKHGRYIVFSLENRSK